MAKDKAHRTSSSNLDKNNARSENYRGDAKSKRQQSQTGKDLYNNLKRKK